MGLTSQSVFPRTGVRGGRRSSDPIGITEGRRGKISHTLGRTRLFQSFKNPIPMAEVQERTPPPSNPSPGEALRPGFPDVLARLLSRTRTRLTHCCLPSNCHSLPFCTVFCAFRPPRAWEPCVRARTAHPRAGVTHGFRVGTQRRQPSWALVDGGRRLPGRPWLSRLCSAASTVAWPVIEQLADRGRGPLVAG